MVVTAADTEEPPRLLNYLTAPQVLVWSAVACSSAFPLLFEPQPLMARWVDGSTVEFMSALGSWAEGGAGAATTTATAGKVAGGEVTPSGSPGIGPPGAPWPSPKPAAHHRRWRDGSLEADLPMAGLSEMFNVNYFLVSQANPYLLPIIALKKATPRALGHLVESEFKHRCRQVRYRCWSAGGWRRGRGCGGDDEAEVGVCGVCSMIRVESLAALLLSLTCM